MHKITVTGPPPTITTADSRERDLRERVAAMEAAATALLAVLDAHEDATDSVMGEAYHPRHQDAVYEAKSVLRAALKGSP